VDIGHESDTGRGEMVRIVQSAQGSGGITSFGDITVSERAGQEEDEKRILHRVVQEDYSL
jgi:hypothetical protein